MDVEAIIGRMMQVYSVENPARLARKLGLPAQSISGAKERGSVPPLWFFKVGYETGCRIEWLKTGEEPVYHDKQYIVSLPPQIQCLIKDTVQLSPKKQEALLACARLLAKGSEEVAMHLLQQVGYLDQSVEYGRIMAEMSRPRQPPS